jgi:hypothetical protein
VITVNYATSPPLITQAVRDMVDQIFAECFGELGANGQTGECSGWVSSGSPTGSGGSDRGG